jgi:ABC-2 type transport system ATP-binding protein
MERVNITDVQDRIIGKLSKGYKQRVGLAQALLNDPPVLILDEPTIGLDPKQIQQIRELIKDLAGSHTVVLSTHILPEVEAMCQRVMIINRGKLVATDTMENLSSRLHGAETVAVEVLSRDGTSSPEWVRSVQEKLEKVAGVSRVIAKDSKDSRARFTVESQKGSQVRPELARAVIEAGWQLNELHGMGLSLEEIFLELTASKEAISEPAPQPAAEEAQ